MKLLINETFVDKILLSLIISIQLNDLLIRLYR